MVTLVTGRSARAEGDTVDTAPVRSTLRCVAYPTTTTSSSCECAGVRVMVQSEVEGPMLTEVLSKPM